MLPPLAAAAATQPAAALMTSPEQRAALVAGPPVTAVDHRVELGGFAGIFGAARDSFQEAGAFRCIAHPACKGLEGFEGSSTRGIRESSTSSPAEGRAAEGLPLHQGAMQQLGTATKEAERALTVIGKVDLEAGKGHNCADGVLHGGTARQYSRQYGRQYNSRQGARQGADACDKRLHHAARPQHNSTRSWQ